MKLLFGYQEATSSDEGTSVNLDWQTRCTGATTRGCARYDRLGAREPKAPRRVSCSLQRALSARLGTTVLDLETHGPEGLKRPATFTYT